MRRRARAERPKRATRRNAAAPAAPEAAPKRRGGAVIWTSLVLVVVGVVVNRALRDQRDIALRQADELDEQLQRTRQLLYTAQLLRVGSVWESDPLQGLAMLEDPRACPPDLRCFSWRVLHAQCKRYRESIPVPGGADAVALGQGGSIAWAGSGGAVYLRKGENVPTKLAGHTARIICLTFTQDGKALASAARDGRIVVWDMPAGVARPAIDAPRGRVAGLAWQIDGRVLAVNAGPVGGAGTLTPARPANGQGAARIQGGNESPVRRRGQPRR